ncbi:MAG: hypothetical protein GF308_07365 [Candidatus Heimdallarchaeota archaeon]|nr:hypothetical protein [Candidatus Heimdallarchaeota archaeon]
MATTHCADRGVAGLVYLFINLADLNRLAQYPRPEGVPSTQTNLTFYLVSLLCISLLPLTIFYLYYLKFVLFKNYLTAYQQHQPGEELQKKPKILSLMGGAGYFLLNVVTAVFSGGLAFLSLINAWSISRFQILFGLCCLVLPLLLVYGFYQQWLWQRRMNQQVLQLDPSAKQGLL